MNEMQNAVVFDQEKVYLILFVDHTLRFQWGITPDSSGYTPGTRCFEIEENITVRDLAIWLNPSNAKLTQIW